MKRTLIPGFVLCLLLGLSPAARAGDMILQKNGQWLPSPPAGKGPTPEELDASILTVLEENYDGVRYKFELGRSSVQTLPAENLQEVVYGNPPSSFREAVGLMNAGNYADALAKFRDLSNNRSNRDWVRMYSLSNMGRILQGDGEYEEAIAIWDRLTTEFPKGRFVPDALVNKGLAYLNLGDQEKAVAAFRSINSLSGLPPGRKMLARYYEIWIKQKQGEMSRNAALLNQALGEYRRLLADVESDKSMAEVANKARLGVGDCLLALDKSAEAKDFFRQISETSDDSSVLAGAFNGLGRCALKEEKWKEALLSFLRTVVLYNTDDDQTAMALYYAGNSYTLLQGEDWRERSRTLFRECIARYPNTEWAKESQLGLKRR